jgi:hypothetical protein
MVVFNRFDESKIDRMELHKIVRGVSRRVNIAYETPDHEISYDEIEDPLPFDLEADPVEIADRDYAIWYRDMSEEMEKYQGKTLRLKGMVARDPALPAHSFVIGRHVMTCCMDDIAYRGLVCIGEGKCKLESKDWVMLTARLEIEYHKLYRSKGPVLKVISVEEKPKQPKSNYCVTGLYFYNSDVCKLAKTLTPSARGELEITDLNNLYLKQGKLEVKLFSRGFTWMDAGTPDSLCNASSFIQALQSRQGIVISAPEEIAYLKGWITEDSLRTSAARYKNSSYGVHLSRIAEGKLRYGTECDTE